MKQLTKSKLGRFLSLLLVLATVTGLLPFTASAEDATVIDNVEITGVVIPIEGETPKYDCIIPEDCGYYVDGVYWENSSYQRLDKDDTFVAGKSYTFTIVLFPEDGYTFKDRSELKATVNGDKASDIRVDFNAPESRIIEKKVYIYPKDEQIIDVSSWGELKNAFDEANKDYMSPMAGENITVRLQNDLYLNAYDLPRSTRYMVRLNVLRNITLDFNGHTLHGTADLPQDENSELESFLEFKVHPNFYIKNKQTVLTFKDSAGGGGVDFDISQWKDSQLAAIHVDYVNTYWVEGYLNGKRAYIEQSTGYWVCKAIFDGGNYKMNCDTVKFSNGTKCVGDRVRYRGTVVVTNIQTTVNGGRYEAYCDGVTVKGDNFGARDLAAFGIETIYVCNSPYADPESEYYEKFSYGEDLTINDGLFISDHGYSVRHFDRFWQGDANDVKFDYFIAPMLNGGVYVGPVNFSSKSFIYMNDGSPYLNKKDLTKMTDPKCSPVLNGEFKSASQITLKDLADEDTEFFAVIDNAYCAMNDVSLNGVNLGKYLRGACYTGSSNTLTWTFDELAQEMKDLGFSYKCKVRDNKGGTWRYVTPTYSNGTGTVKYSFNADTAGVISPGFMLELCYGDSVVRYGGYGFRMEIQDYDSIYRLSANWVDMPVDGANPDFGFNPSLGSLFTVSSVDWYNATDKVHLSSTSVFEKGKTYVFTAGFKANDGYAFADSDSLKATFNKDLKASFVSASADRTEVYYSYTFTGAEKITSASVTVDGVVAFSTYGSKDATAGDPGKYTVDAEVFGLFDASSAEEINPDDSCRIVVGFIPNEGYAFPDPATNNVKATINGYTAHLYDYYDGTIWFYYDYYIGTCFIPGVSFSYNEPVTGGTTDDFMLRVDNRAQKPNHVITIKDIYWADNGTDEAWDWIDMKKGDTFIDGHNYCCVITFGLSDSEFFMYDTSNGFNVTGNGVDIPSIYDDNSGNSYNPPTGAHKDFTVSLYFKASESNTVYNAGITTKPLTAGITVAEAQAKTNLDGSLVWFRLDSEDSGVMLTDTDRLEAGKTYRISINLTTPEGKVFAPNATVTVNGDAAVVDSLYGNALYAHYDFSIPYGANPFTDVKSSKWYYEPIMWAVSNGITDGMTPTTFEPDSLCTRAQVVTFIWRMYGCPEPKTSANPFKDVKASSWYYKAVLWAVENGITEGMSATTFEPNTKCTRAQGVTFIWRLAGTPENKSGTNPFKDVKSGSWYYKAVLWAVENGITDGMTPTTFEPNTKCSRAHIVTFLQRFNNIPE